MNVFAKFDEIPLKILKVIKEAKRNGHTHTHTVGRTDNVKTVYPPTNTVCGGYNYDGLEPPMLHTKFRGNQPAGSGVEDFLKGFSHIWAWRPSWSCDQHHIIRFSFPCT